MGIEKAKNGGFEGWGFGAFEYSLCRFNPYQAIENSKGGF